jgi:hypothetical protein
MNKSSIIYVVIIIAIVVSGYAFYSKYSGYSSKGSSVETGDGAICTMEALQCPDGSYVGREGPQCKFKSCPGGSFTGALIQNENGFFLHTDAAKEGTQEVVYVLPLQIKVSNALKDFVGKNVIVYGSFSDGNNFIVDRLEEVSGVESDPTIGYIKVGQSKLVGGVRITLNKIISDSRCPKDVQCIQAGSAKFEVALQSNTEKTETTIDSVSNSYKNKPVLFDSFKVYIVDVSPQTNSKTKISTQDYVVGFKVESNPVAN